MRDSYRFKPLRPRFLWAVWTIALLLGCGNGGGNSISGSGGGGFVGLSGKGGSVVAAGGANATSVGAGGATEGRGGSKGRAGAGAGAQAVGGAGGGVGGSSGTNAGQAGGAGQDRYRCDVAISDPQNPPKALTLSGNLGAHDPAAVEQNGVVYLSYTGRGVPAKTSKDLLAWNSASSAFGNSNPGWIATQVPGATSLWAPDLSFFNGQYHIYYSVSTFGSNSSCIGHATRASMESGSWTDQGSVVCSKSGDNWNAIDPNVVVDAEGTPWLSFGSFWSGIKLIELDKTGARANSDLHSIASRGGSAIEAPYIVRRCGYYYLFVSFDKCCNGTSSTYNIRVGRSEQVKGPYVDKDGKQMMEGGGTQLVVGDNTWRGPGHNAVLFVGKRAYNIYHAYASNAGTLRVSEMVWDTDGWPISGGP
jgi:arabinan endo-1,5-alpha-L-arabinosidase